MKRLFFRLEWKINSTSAERRQALFGSASSCIMQLPIVFNGVRYEQLIDLERTLKKQCHAQGVYVVVTVILTYEMGISYESTCSPIGSIACVGKVTYHPSNGTFVPNGALPVPGRTQWEEESAGIRGAGVSWPGAVLRRTVPPVPSERRTLRRLRRTRRPSGARWLVPGRCQ